jgi:hypothetical protein
MLMEKMQVLKRDGREVKRGTYIEVLDYIHRNHSYSFDHAVRFEGYSVEDAPSEFSPAEAYEDCT